MPRPRALTLRLAGRAVKAICLGLGRAQSLFHQGWRRYLAFGADGLFDLTRARHVAPHIPPDLERTIVSIGRRLQAHAQPRTRYALSGAGAIRAELKALNSRPLPSPRTIERVLQRHGYTLPRERLPRLLPRQVYPARGPSSPTTCTRSIWSGRSTSSASSTATTFGCARTPAPGGLRRRWSCW